QLWVNLPKRDKMIAPRYQDTPSERIPVVERDGVRVKVIAGEAMGAHAVIDTHTPIFYLHYTLTGDQRVVQPVAAGYNGLAYVFRGCGQAGGRPVRDGDAVVFAQDGDAIELSGGMDVLVIGGLPIGEPVVRYGPFVMTTEEEILQAVQDFRAGR